MHWETTSHEHCIAVGEYSERVGWADFLSDSLIVELGLVESRRFGLKIVNVRGGRGERSFQGLRHAFSQLEFDVAVVRYPTDNRQVGTALKDLGYGILVTEPTVYWSKNLDKRSDPREVQQLQRVSSVEALETLKNVVSSSFANYQSHWHHNPLTEDVDMVDVYVEWLEYAIGQPDHLAYSLQHDDDDLPIGMAMLRTDLSSTEVLLAGISADHQGQGHYSSILRGVEALAHEVGSARLVISTQSANVNVQKAWSRNGWSPMFTVQTVHVVRGNE